MVLFAVVLLGCSKPSEPAPPTPTPTPATSATVAPTASVTQAIASASAAAAPEVAAVTGDAGIACGKRPLPDCPLQAWMKENANPPVMANDTAKLAIALERMVALAPPAAAYPNWVSIAKDGASAARAGDMSAAKASCRGCHDQYKSPYRTTMRARKI